MFTTIAMKSSKAILIAYRLTSRRRPRNGTLFEWISQLATSFEACRHTSFCFSETLSVDSFLVQLLILVRRNLVHVLFPFDFEPYL